MERALSRLQLGRGGPRDLLCLAAGLTAACALRLKLEGEELFHTACAQLGSHDALLQKLHASLKTECGMFARDGGFIKPGFHPGLDRHQLLQSDGKRLIAALQARYAQETGIQSLKIRFNHVLGYFIEITAAHQAKVGENFIHRQSLAGALRYTTTELAELERGIAEAESRALKLELELFAELVAAVLAESEPIIHAARALAALDVHMALAELAETRRYTRPIVDESLSFEIEAGRHPVVEEALKRTHTPFIGNDCNLNEAQHLWLLTGPNMAGKSTFLRQNALIAILAQMGSFVPAAAARIGMVDKLFSRVGAADDLARGRSTFMVEMVETASILHQATPRSLVILDEIGRGTATYDGLAIAWAVVEHLHNSLHCRALFATHYHELTQLTASLTQLACYSLRVKEWKGELVFLHEIMRGAADRSYGVHVAKLAGLPAPVLARATQLLRELEETRPAPASALPLFAHAPLAKETTHPLIEKIHALNPDEFTPKQALDWLYALKREI